MHKDIFIALAAVAWADGELAADEADAIVRAAADEGLELEDLAAIEEATKKPVTLGDLDHSAMSKADRLFVYAVAHWIAQLDGKVTDEESSTLSRLATKLGIPERPRAGAERLVREVAELPDGDRPSRYDLGHLRRLIGERLAATPSTPPSA